MKQNENNHTGRGGDTDTPNIVVSSSTPNRPTILEDEKMEKITVDTERAIISETGIIHGRGCDKFKWVSGLTSEERETVKGGGIVLIRDDCGHHATTEFKRVIHKNGRYYHRNYYGEEI